MGSLHRLWLMLAALTGLLWPAHTTAEMLPVAHFVQAFGNSRLSNDIDMASAALRSQEVLRRIAAAYGMSAPEYFVETDVRQSRCP
jgi:hypothetical protein